MRRLAERIVTFLQDESGPTAVEYAIILALNVILCVVSITAMGSNANKTLTNLNAVFSNVTAS